MLFAYPPCLIPIVRGYLIQLDVSCRYVRHVLYRYPSRFVSGKKRRGNWRKFEPTSDVMATFLSVLPTVFVTLAFAEQEQSAG